MLSLRPLDEVPGRDPVAPAERRLCAAGPFRSVPLCWDGLTRPLRCLEAGCLDPQVDSAICYVRPGFDAAGNEIVTPVVLRPAYCVRHLRARACYPLDGSLP